MYHLSEDKSKKFELISSSSNITDTTSASASSSSPQIPINNGSKSSVSLILRFVSSEIHHSIEFPQLTDIETPNYTYATCSSLSYEQSSSASSDDTTVEPSYIDKLPFEIRYIIAENLSQYDAVNLLCVNKSFFRSTIPRIYHTIVIDPSYSYFDQDIYELDYGVNTVNEVTFIKGKYSFKEFLKQLNEDLTLINGEDGLPMTYSRLVNEIKVVELPDNFYTPFDLQFFSTMSIKKMRNLHKFHWNSEVELPFDVVERLQNKQNFNSLQLNLDFKKLAGIGLSLSQDFSYRDYFSFFQGFRQLEKLSIESFQNSNNLYLLFNNLVKGNMKMTLSDHSLSRLSVLKLARFNSANHNIKNLSSSLLVLTQYIIANDGVDMSEYDLDCTQSLVRSIGKANDNLKGLKKVSFDSFLVATKDAQLLSEHIVMANITQLELRNVTEVQMLDDSPYPLSNSEIFSRLDEGFLQRLSRSLINLQKLYIDYRESLRDTVPKFIETLKMINSAGGLKELDITIRWNVTKICSVSSWKDLCTQYIKAILSHSATLEKLSLDTKEDSVFSELHKLIPPDLLMELKKLTRVVSLRLHGYSIQPFAPALVESLSELRYLELFGSGAGGAPHMGQQVVHDGVLDDWLRVQHVASAINRSNQNIKFIKIDKCLFEIQNQQFVVPRYSNLERWFDEKVRVSLARDFSG
ncbi:hypothetical protein WICPIJ_009116 [Wickerhamomyces pijperi]|uniref:F-box domain-containing protein n=1 Tax=Wickerhamomyces pijperi TaxID=599730 RepID=A0A9P8TFA1_WICPI|nr:hypothetical protein WICPIJ_009116 [Wickerhamomyces pijperi]